VASGPRGWSGDSLFASVPAGAKEIARLGECFGARADHVAAAQSFCILVVVIVVPFAYALLGAQGSDRYVPGTTAPRFWEALQKAGLPLT